MSRTILQRQFGDRSDGAFPVVFRVAAQADPAVRRGSSAWSTAKPGRCRPAADLAAPGRPARPVRQRHLDARTCRGKGGLGRPRRTRSGSQPDAEAYVTGAPAIQHDLDPIFSRDPAKGESIALPIALVVLLLVFGLSWAVTDAVPVRGRTMMGTLWLVYVIAHWLDDGDLCDEPDAS